MERKVGKRVGSCVYVHKLYEDEVIPAKILKAAKKHISYSHQFSYDCVKWDKKTNNITFQWSPTFDNWDEPIVGKCFLVRSDGTNRILPDKKNPQIWHHKWMWVKDDYSGFDVEKSKMRSELWKDKVTKEERRKIGYLSFWDSICHRWDNL